MENSFVDEIVKKIIEKIKVTGKYKSVFANLDSNNSASKVIVNFCEILFNKVWDENEEKFIPAYQRVLNEPGDKKKITDDYLGRNQVFELTQGEEHDLYKLISPLVAIMKNFNEEMPEEMKLALLADCFNAIAHNMEIAFGDKMGQKFWFDLKNDVLVEMINRFDKDSVYIKRLPNSKTVSIFFKVKVNGDVDFLSWHSKANVLESMSDFKYSDYQNPQLEKEIQIRPTANNPSKSSEQQFSLYNHQLYHYVFQYCIDNKKQISDVFRVEFVEDKKLNVEEGKEVTDFDTLLSKLIENIEKAASEQEVENLINKSGLADQIQNLKILRLRGAKRIFYVALQVNEKNVVIKCKEGFECTYTGKCYTKLEIAQIENPESKASVQTEVIEENPSTETVNREEKEIVENEESLSIEFVSREEIETTENREIGEKLAPKIKQPNNIEAELNKSSIFEIDAGDSNLKLSQLDKLIKQSDFTEIIGLLPENEEVQKIFKILSHETINPEDIVSRSVAFAIGLDILAQNGAPDELKKLQEQVLEILIKDLISKNNISFLEYAQARTNNVKLYVEIKLDETHTTLIPASEEFYRHMSKEINVNREEKGYSNALTEVQKNLRKRDFEKLSDGYSIEEILARFSDEIPDRIVDVEIGDEIRDSFEGGGSYDVVVEIKEEHIQSNETIEESVEEAHAVENQNATSSTRMEEQVDETAKSLAEKSEEEVHIVENQNGDSSTKMEDQIGECLISKKEQLNRITAELSTSEMYEHILFCVETMLPEDKFAILEAQLEKMSPSEEYMFLLKMLEKFKPVRDKNDGKDNIPEDNKRGGGPKR